MGDLLLRDIAPSSGKPTWVFERAVGCSFEEQRGGGLLICTLPKEHVMPMVCINLLCRLYTSHNVLQFHVPSGVLCSRGFYFIVFASPVILVVASIIFTMFPCYRCLRWGKTGKREEMGSLPTRRAITILLVLWEGCLYVIQDMLLLKEVVKAA